MVREQKEEEGDRVAFEAECVSKKGNDNRLGSGEGEKGKGNRLG